MSLFGGKKEIEVTHVNEKTVIIDNRVYIRKDDDAEDLVFLKVISDLVKIIDRLTKPHPQPPGEDKTRMVLSTTFNNSKLQTMALELQSNQKAALQVALQDTVTGTAVADAVAANVTHVSDNTGAATIDADNNLVGVAEGGGNVTSDADWTYTNSLGVSVTEHKQVVTPFTITPPAQTANPTEMTVTLGTPVNQ